MPDHQGFDTDTGLPTALAQTPAAWTVRVLLDNRNFKNFGLKRLVIRNFEEEFEGDWGKVRNKIHELSEVLPLPYLPPPGIRNFIALSIEDPAIKAIESKFPKKVRCWSRMTDSRTWHDAILTAFCSSLRSYPIFLPCAHHCRRALTCWRTARRSSASTLPT